MNTDCIFVMDKGRLIEYGTHNELLQKNGLYKRLWDKQNGFTQKGDGFSFAITTDRLKKIPFFEHLDEQHLMKMTEAFVTEQYGADHIVVRQGERNRRFFILVRGKAEFTVTDEEDIVESYDIFSDGDCFGETALLERGTKWVLLRTLTPCVFLSLRHEDFEEVLHKNSELYKKTEEAINQVEERKKAELEALCN